MPLPSVPVLVIDPPLVESPHVFFDAQAAHPTCLAAYSLRDPAQLVKYRQGLAVNQSITYAPTLDTYHTPQDAAKITWSVDAASITQVHLPIGITGGSLTLIWDFWYGREFLTERGGLNIHKAFQLSSHHDNSERYVEVRSHYGVPGGLCSVDVRPYGGKLGAGMSEGYLGRVEPMVGSFIVQPETWTRYTLRWEARDPIDVFSLWICDETRDSVQIYREAAVGAFDHTLTKIRIELNSSQKRVGPPLVAYTRNWLMLRNLDDLGGLWQRPVGHADHYAWVACR